MKLAVERKPIGRPRTPMLNLQSWPRPADSGQEWLLADAVWMGSALSRRRRIGGGPSAQAASRVGLWPVTPGVPRT